MEQEKKYFCKVCGSVLVIKKDLLFCNSCGIFMGNPKTYQKAFDPVVSKSNLTLPKQLTDKAKRDLSVLASVYIAVIFAVGISIILYIGFNSGMLLGKIICENLTCI